jgi:hypothetical protein
VAGLDEHQAAHHTRHQRHGPIDVQALPPFQRGLRLEVEGQRHGREQRLPPLYLLNGLDGAFPDVCIAHPNTYDAAASPAATRTSYPLDAAHSLGRPWRIGPGQSQVRSGVLRSAPLA